MYVTSDRLPPHQLAALLKALVDYAYKYPRIGGVSELLDAVAGEWSITLTEDHHAQVYGAVSSVVPSIVAASTPVSSRELESAVAASIGRDAGELYKVLYRAWTNVVSVAKQQPAELVLVETGGLLVPDPRDKDLDGLGIAEMFVLVAHDRFDGRPLLAEPVLACGVAAALLAELTLRDLIRLDLGSHQVQVTSVPSSPPAGISAPVRQALEVIQDGELDALGAWLTALSGRGYRAVRRHLENSGTVVREVRGRFRKKTHLLPAGEIVDSIFRVATRPLAVGRLPTAPCAVVIELAKATRLTAARHGEWIHVHHMDPGATLGGAAGRERLELLLALTRAEVTELLNRP